MDQVQMQLEEMVVQVEEQDQIKVQQVVQETHPQYHHRKVQMVEQLEVVQYVLVVEEEVLL